MKKLEVKTNPALETIFDNYPSKAKKKMLALRKLVLETAEEMEEISKIEETLKWGEPSFLTKYGSTLRMDWKKGKPDEYALYFQCTSSLVPTFKMVFQDQFRFEGNRAIVFQLDEKIPKAALKKCISACLRYHKVKHLPALGI